ncbi:uncharacterized protein LOC142322651 [Lycorma delicatula]|uniref:uncharacterized protein LOC142322651 n=1 Tax=Lycorma delicatula TaxID=130591 RepID=UPI003F517C60
MRKWSSNHKSLLNSLPQELVNTKTSIQLEKKDSIQILVFKWFPQPDVFSISSKIPPFKDVVTKREVASTVASIYDPIGLISSIVISYKIFLQRLWLSGIGWDNLPSSLLQKWHVLVSQLSLIDDIKINRRVIINNPTAIEVHGFCDASQHAFGACLYLRSVNSEGEISVQLLCSKSRVAPVKTVSIPLLELCGTLLLSKLLPILNLSIERVHLWTDSKICLWKTFVANRVSQIQDLTDVNDWKHVASSDNPADLISRGSNPESLDRD